MTIPDNRSPIGGTDKQTFRTLIRRAAERRENALSGFSDAQIFRLDAGDLAHGVGRGKLRRARA
jgi:hypothetical protein